MRWGTTWTSTRAEAAARRARCRCRSRTGVLTSGFRIAWWESDEYRDRLESGAGNEVVLTDLSTVLQAAESAGAQQAEVFAVESEETPVRFEANRLKEINARQTSGVALRVIVDGRIGFASSTKPGDVSELVAAAMETAPFGPEAHLEFPRDGEAPTVDVLDAAVESLPVDDMIQAGQSLIAA